MSSVKNRSGVAARPTPRPKQGQTKAATAHRAQPASIPWYFWAVLGGVIILGVVLLGTLLGNSSATNQVSTAAQRTGNTADARQLLTNGYGEGNPNAPVKVVEYGDFECPACAYFYQNVYPQVKQQYIDTGKIYYYYKPFPLISVHPKALPSAELATCAADYGSDKFFAIHDLLYSKQNDWVSGDENTVWGQYISQVGLDPTKVMACVTKNTHQAIMDANESEAAALGVNSTPTFFVNTTKLIGPNFDQFKQAIDSASR